MAKIQILVWSRGKEVYGCVYLKDGFDANEFKQEHEDDYFDLSDDAIDSEIAIEISKIMVYQDGNLVLEQCNLPEHVNIINTKRTESYRELLQIGENEVGAVWFHDYVNTYDATWKDASNFDISKVNIHSLMRIDDTDDTEYPICCGVTYEGNDPDDYEIYGSPKSGYFGFTVLD